MTLEPVATDPPAENRVKRSREVHRILDSPATAQQQVNAGPFAGRTVAQVIDRIYTADIYMHTWDLARAAGLQPSMDPQFAETMLAGMHPIESMLRDSGQFGLAMHTDSTDPVDQLMAFVGRQV